MRHTESRLQKSCVMWFRVQYPRLRSLLFAVPNGGARSAVTGAILKSEGVLAGVADLLLLVPSKSHHGLCIEMKTAKGRQTATQKHWETAVTLQGYKYIVCRSFTDFVEQIDDYLNG